MLPPRSIMLAANRWLALLQSSSVPQAGSILSARAQYSDLTLTQYSTALQLLRKVEVVPAGPGSDVLCPTLQQIPLSQLRHLFLERVLVRHQPTWLADVEALADDESDLPVDYLLVAQSLGLSEDRALDVARGARGKVDLSERNRVGLLGEKELVRLLEEAWPGSVRHVALADDGFGYDLVWICDKTEWHIEVKTTTRLGRFLLFLSRREFSVALRDPRWRLVGVCLGSSSRAVAVGTVRHERLVSRSPIDVHPGATWQSTRHQLSGDDFIKGLSFAPQGDLASDSLLRGQVLEPVEWLP